MTIKEKYNIANEEYFACVKELLESSPVIEMEKYLQHGTTSTLEHCIRVSYKSYRLAKILKLDYRAIARAALLHDLFLYDWHTAPHTKKLFEKHGYTHPGIALENANKYFNLTKKEQEIIYRHMWPLTLRRFPKSRETMLVCLVDKYASTSETINPYLEKMKGKLV